MCDPSVYISPLQNIKSQVCQSLSKSQYSTHHAAYGAEPIYTHPAYPGALH